MFESRRRPGPRVLVTPDRGISGAQRACEWSFGSSATVGDQRGASPSALTQPGSCTDRSVLGPPCPSGLRPGSAALISGTCIYGRERSAWDRCLGVYRCRGTLSHFREFWSMARHCRLVGRWHLVPPAPAEADGYAAGPGSDGSAGYRVPARQPPRDDLTHTRPTGPSPSRSSFLQRPIGPSITSGPAA